MKNVLFIAVTGSLGQFLAVDRLLKDDYFIIFLTRGKGNLTPEQRVAMALNFVQAGASDRYKEKYVVVEGDKLAIPEIKWKIDVIIDVSGATSFAFEDVQETVSVNHDGTVALLKFAEQHRVSEIHYLSTAFVYEQGLTEAREIFYDYSKTFNNPYARSKGAAEYEIILWNRKKKDFDCRVFVYRGGIFVGHSQTGLITNFFGLYRCARPFYRVKNIYAKRNKHLDEVFFLPINVPGKPDATINLVTIDYIVEMISRIEKAGVPGIYNITNANPPKYELLLRETLKCMNIVGPSSLRNPKDTPEEFKAIEAKIAKGVAAYVPFMASDVVFDQSNCKKALGPDFIEHPEITPEQLKILIDFAVSCDFDKEIALSKVLLRQIYDSALSYFLGAA